MVGEEYPFHFSISGFSILLLDLIFNNRDTYGAADYVVFYNKGIARAYLSPLGWQECRNIGAALLNDGFVENLIKESEDLLKVFHDYKPTELNGGNAKREWEKYLTINDKFCGLYRFYEQPFEQAIEQRVLKSIPEGELVGILSHGNFGKVSDLEIRKYVERLVIMGKMKLRLHEDSETFFTDKNFTEYVARLSNLAVELAEAMRRDEFANAIEGKMIVSTEELKDRLKQCVFVREDGKWNLYTGDKYIYWKDKVQGVSMEIKGSVAFRGMARGKVVVHLSWTGVTSIEEGDILVTGMTNPQMIPLLKKAAAIVTDEGGITCHAAIISRELRKPCIVGTKNATQILKDGDMVEVDAERGIVRKI